MQYFTSLIYTSEKCANFFGHPDTSFSPLFLPRARWKLIGNPKVYLGLHFTVWCLFFIQILYGQTQSNSESITWKLKKKNLGYSQGGVRIVQCMKQSCPSILSFLPIIFSVISPHWGRIVDPRGRFCDSKIIEDILQDAFVSIPSF